MSILINYYHSKKSSDYRCYIFFYDKKNSINTVKENFVLKNQTNIINEGIKLSIKQNEEISEINLSSKLKIILVSLDLKKKIYFMKK